jgi:hypothetical protein
LGIISIRVSSDIPVQSSYLPLISLFFMLNILFTFVSFAWFVAYNRFKSEKYLPLFLIKIIDIIFKKNPHKMNEQVALNQVNENNQQTECNAESYDNVINDPDLNLSELLHKNGSYFNEKLNKFNLIGFIFMVVFMFISYFYILLSI